MDIKRKIKTVIQEIVDENGLQQRNILDDSFIVRDLGFTSLDVAELIAVLEMELDADPFSNGVSLMDVRTYGELCAVYENSLKEKGG